MALNIQDLSINSPDIATGERIPDTFTADHGNMTPKINVTGVPEGTSELAVIMHDPDAPLPNGFTHWGLYGIAPQDGDVGDSDFRTGPNTLGDSQYSGPQPPPGHGQHHYYFWVFALDTSVEGQPNREEFLSQYAGNIIEQNRFVATYSA